MRCITILAFLLKLTASQAQTSDTVLLKQHMLSISNDSVFRNYANLKELNRVAQYITDVFKQYSDSVKWQEYSVNGITYKNIICSFGTQHQQRIVVGAHYDVCGNQAGADDNASGVVGLLELARLLHQQNIKTRIDLVAYTLEEPPYFRSEYMGSYIHAKFLYDNFIPVKGMICLEMIGYYSNQKKTQSYPVGLLRLFYGSRGNYITVVQKFFPGSFARKTKRQLKHQNLIRTKSFKGPKALPGIDFSDHLNYWKFGYSSLMLTNTAFYRNKNYHQSGDTPAILNYTKMGLVINQVARILIK